MTEPDEYSDDHVELDVEQIMEVLVRHQVEFVVIGGFAVNMHGFLRATGDLDIMADLAGENLQRLASALDELNATLRGIGDLEHDLSPRNPDDLARGGNWSLRTDHGDLDQFGSPSGAAPYTDVRGRAVIFTTEVGHRIPVVGLDDLIAMKLSAGRRKDLADVSVLARRHPELGLDLDLLDETE